MNQVNNPDSPWRRASRAQPLTPLQAEDEGAAGVALPGGALQRASRAHPVVKLEADASDLQRELAEKSAVIEKLTSIIRSQQRYIEICQDQQNYHEIL
jgi:hypothetical protein